MLRQPPFQTSEILFRLFITATRVRRALAIAREIVRGRTVGRSSEAVMGPQYTRTETERAITPYYEPQETSVRHR